MSTPRCETCHGHRSGTCCDCGYTGEASRHAETRRLLTVECQERDDEITRLRKEIAVCNELLRGRLDFMRDVAALVGGCEEHGDECIHHLVDRVREIVAQLAVARGPAAAKPEGAGPPAIVPLPRIGLRCTGCGAETPLEDRGDLSHAAGCPLEPIVYSDVPDHVFAECVQACAAFIHRNRYIPPGDCWECQEQTRDILAGCDSYDAAVTAAVRARAAALLGKARP